MMIQFTRTDGRVVSINPAYIRSVDLYGNDDSCIITFAKDDFITITGKYQMVVNTIDAALKDR